MCEQASRVHFPAPVQISQLVSSVLCTDATPSLGPFGDLSTTERKESLGSRLETVREMGVWSFHDLGLDISSFSIFVR